MKRYLAAALLACTLNAFGQGEIYLEEGFEHDGSMPEGWSQVYVGKQSEKPEYLEWLAKEGGGRPAGSEVNKPETAHSGDYNARLYYLEYGRSYGLYLITKNIDFSNAHKPLLTFWYSQYSDRASTTDSTEIENFEISLCYRIMDAVDTTWHKVRDYTEPTDDAEPWRTDSVWLPEDINGHNRVQIGFLGTTKTLGHGCCIDDIKIQETQITKKYVGSITASHPTTDIIPTSSTDNVIICLRVQTLGNDGNLLLNTLTASTLQKTSTVTKSNGVKLYYTENNVFNTDCLLSTTTITNEKATFSNIGFDLPAGHSYLWITCDIKDDDDHRFRNYIADMEFESGSIDIGGLKYPASGPGLNPTGERLIIESVVDETTKTAFVDNFEDLSHTNELWPTITGEFERAQPQKFEWTVPLSGKADPTSAHSGSWMIGTNITGDEGRGFEPHGAYSRETESYIESKTIDCYYYKDVNLTFYRWLNQGYDDTASIKISTDNGLTWQNLWTNTTITTNKNWNYRNIDLSTIADRNHNIKFRFAMNPYSKLTNLYSGWNIDDVALVGTYVYMDAAMASIISPNTGCGLSNAETVTIKIKNAGANDIVKPFNVSYSTDDGSTWVTETVNESIARDGYITYTFSQKADLTTYGPYNIHAKVTLIDDNNQPIDDDNRNDEIQKRIMSLPYVDVPFAENFDTYGYWYCNNDMWQHTKPAGSPSYLWKTKTTRLLYEDPDPYADPTYLTRYLPNSTDTLFSPCLNMSNVQKPILEFKLKGDVADTDGLTAYYSTDGGATWKHLLEYSADWFTYKHPSWKWYNTEDDIDALGKPGWTGRFNWTTIKQLLPDDVAGESAVKLCFVFGAGDYDNEAYEGFAIDDIKIYESPVDAGVVAIKPESDCHLLEEQPITVTIQNYGNRAITSADSLIASVTINDKITLTDTFFVAENVTIGGTFEYEFKQKVNMWYKKSYTMDASTKIKGDTLLFKNTRNDSHTATATVLGEPQYDLGADVGTMTPLAFNPKPNGGVMSNGQDFYSYKWYWYDYKSDTKHESPGKELSAARKFEEPLPDDPTKNEIDYYCYIDVTVKVNNDKYCTETDSIKIIKSNVDVAIASVTGITEDESFCRNREFNIDGENDLRIKVKITVQNKAATEVDEDFKIGIGYKMLDADNNTVSHIEEIQYNNVLQADELDNGIAEYTFEQQPKFEYDGTQKIEFFTEIWADLDYSNNTLTRNVTVFPLPTADIMMDDSAYDSILLASPNGIILTTDIISGATYKWQDNSTSNTLEIGDDKRRVYEVTVTDILHNCGSATDNVLVVTDNWVLAELVSPTDNCDPQSGIDITVRIENNSSNSYPAGYMIPATVRFNGNTYNELITLQSALDEYDYFEHTFNTKIDMPEIGAYKVFVKINPPHDINRDDNTLDSEVDIWGTPRIYLGPDTVFTLQQDIKLSIGPEFNYCYWESGGKAVEAPEFTTSGNVCYVIAQNEHNCYAADQKTLIEGFYYAADTIVFIKTNIGIDKIESPIAACDIESFNAIRLLLTNDGLDKIANGSEIPFMVKINDEAPIRKVYTLQTSFKTDTTMEAIIPFEPNFNKDQSYNFTVWLDWNMDHFRQNDTATTMVSQYPNPDPFYLGDDIYTTSPDTVVLHAPENYYNYKWNGGQSSTNTLAISYIGTRTYGVKVSNQYGCSYADSLVVSLTSPEIEITDLGLSTNICESESLSDVSFTLKNVGTDIIAKGSQIDIEYSIDGETPVSETYKVGRTLVSGESVAITFKHQADFRSAASYALNITASIADTVAVSSKDYTVNVHESPKVSLGNDVRTFESSVNLTPGSGFSSYLWSTGATTEKINVIEDGKYWVKVTNTYGCVNYDTVNVRIIPAKVTIDQMKQPQSACSIEKEPIEINIVNNGTTKIESSSTIGIKCYVDQNEPFTKTMSFDFDIKSSRSLRLDSLLTLESTGTHNISFVITIDNAAIDSTSFELDVYGHPDFAFENETLEVNGFPYTLAPASALTEVTYEWSTGAKSNAIEVTADGTYTLTVSDKNQCSTTKSATVKQRITGISNATIADITVYPNPARDIVNIDFDGQLTKDCQILIANASGQIIFASKQTDDIMKIDVDDWAQGMYFIKITSNNESRVIKFVKE